MYLYDYMCVFVFINYLHWEAEDILSPNVKFHENRNHGLLNPEVNLGKPSSYVTPVCLLLI